MVSVLAVSVPSLAPPDREQIHGQVEKKQPETEIFGQLLVLLILPLALLWESCNLPLLIPKSAWISRLPRCHRSISWDWRGIHRWHHQNPGDAPK